MKASTRLNAQDLIKVLAFSLCAITVHGCGKSGSVDSSNSSSSPEAPEANDTDAVTDEPVFDDNQLSGDDSGFIGMLNVDAFDNEVEITAGFKPNQSGVTVAALRRTINQSLDTCSIYSGDSVVEEDVLTPADDADFILDAGDAITVNSNSGTFATLERFTFGDLVAYQSASNLIGPAPAGLTADIPGSVFPAFSNINIPALQPLLISAPSTEQIAADTVFTWNGSQQRSVRVSIEIDLNSSANGQELIRCYARDDGSFTLPADVQAAFKSGASAETVYFGRTAFSFVTRDGAFVIVTRSQE